jgi:chromosome segregation ATPase
MIRSVDDIDADLDHWSATIARMGAALEALTQNPAFLRLKTQNRLGGLSGVSAPRAAAADTAAAELWSLYLALDRIIAEASELRRSKNPFGFEERLKKIDALLNGRTIDPPGASKELAQLSLTGARTSRLSLAEVIEAMDKAFNATRDIIATAERGWDTSEALGALRERARRIEADARSLGFAPPKDLETAARAIEDHTQKRDSDPIGADDELGRIEDMLDDADGELAAARKDQFEAADALRRAQQRLQGFESLCRQAEASRAERLAKIADPAPKGALPSTRIDDLRGWLATLETTLQSGRARAAQIGARSWTAEIEKREAALAETLAEDKRLLDARAELRGRFSALKAKADSLGAQGRLKPQDVELFNEARDLLFGKATPLPQAVQLMRRCERS